MSRGIVGKEAGEAVARVKVPSMYRKQAIKHVRRAQRSREKRRRNRLKVWPRLPQIWRRFSDFMLIKPLAASSRTARVIVRMDSFSFFARLRRLTAQLSFPQQRAISMYTEKVLCER